MIGIDTAMRISSQIFIMVIYNSRSYHALYASAHRISEVKKRRDIRKEMYIGILLCGVTRTNVVFCADVYGLRNAKISSCLFMVERPLIFSLRALASNSVLVCDSKALSFDFSFLVSAAL